jgi:hypothetical protein
MAREQARILQLPLAIIGPVDVGRISRELAAVDEFMTQTALRRPGEPMNVPRTSKLLEETARENKLNLLVDEERRQLMAFLEDIKQKAPVMHFSFAVDPSAVFLQKLTSWLRQEIHPLVLVRIGLQPSIAAGCVLRTPDRYFDFSLRQHFDDKRNMLIERIGAPQ